MSKSKTLQPLKPCQSGMEGKTSHYNAVIIKAAHLAYSQTLKNIMYQESVHGLNFEVLGARKNVLGDISWRLHSARIDQKNRLLCLVLRIEELQVLISLDMIEHHYDRAIILDRRCLKKYVVKWLPAWQLALKHRNETDWQLPHEERVYMVFNDKRLLTIPVAEKSTEVRQEYLEYLRINYWSDEQLLALSLNTPVIDNGMAGTGKTDLLVEAQMQYCAAHPEEKKPGLILVNTVHMQKILTTALENRGGNQDRIHILTWEAFCYAWFAKSLNIAADKVPEVIKLINQSDIEKWYRSEQGPLKQHKLLEKTQGAIPEFSTMKEDIDALLDALHFMQGLSKTEFLALKGERQCLWQEKACREFLYTILESFQNWCKEEGLVYLPLFVMTFKEPDYALITVDEAQNLTLQQLQNLFHSGGGNLVYGMDSNQIVHSNFNIQQNLKKWLEKTVQRAVKVQALTICFRSSAKAGREVSPKLRIFASLRYVADSRAKKGIIRVETAKPARLEYVLDAHRIQKLNTKATHWKMTDAWTAESMEASHQSTREEWEGKVLELVDMGTGYQANAESLYLAQKLGEDSQAFHQFCEHNGRSMPVSETFSEKGKVPLKLTASEDFTEQNIIQWIRSNALFDPEHPEKSRIALILQDPGKYKMLDKVLFQQNYIQHLDGKEFCRFFITPDKKFFHQLGDQTYYNFHYNFLTRHPRGIPYLFEDISPWSKAKPITKSKKTRKNRPKNAQPPKTEKSQRMNYFSWLIQVGPGLLGEVFKETATAWIPYLNTEFFERYLLNLSYSWQGHRLLDKIAQLFTQNTSSSIKPGLSVELFSSCYYHLLYSIQGWGFFTWAIPHNQKTLLPGVIIPAIRSGDKIPSKVYSFKNLLHFTWHIGNYMIDLIEKFIKSKGGKALPVDVLYQKSGFFYNEFCSYTEDVMAFLKEPDARYQHLFDAKWLSHDGYAGMYPILLS